MPLQTISDYWPKIGLENEMSVAATEMRPRIDNFRRDEMLICLETETLRPRPHCDCLAIHCCVDCFILIANN